MKTIIRSIVISLVCFLSITVRAQVYQISNTGALQVCGNASGTLTLMSSATVMKWEVGTFNGTFTVENTIVTSNSSYSYTVTAPAMKAFRAYCSGASGLAYTNVIMVRASEAVDAGSISIPTTSYQGSATGTFTHQGLTGTARWQQQPAGSSTWETSPGGATFTNLTQTTNFKVFVANSDYSCTDESNIIAILVYKVGTLTGPLTAVEGSLATFTLANGFGAIDRWEYSYDGGTTWYHIPSNQTQYSHLMSRSVKVRVLVNQGPTSASLYSNTVDVTMTGYSPDEIQLSGQNYVREQTVLTSGITDPNAVNGLTSAQKQQVTTYQDGFGRPVQQNIKSASPGLKDIVQPLSYDYTGGKEATQYYPYVSALSDGSFAADAFILQRSYYANGVADKVQDDVSPFAKTVFEKSPLKWVTEQGGPGAAWQPGSGHTTQITYTTNETAEVRQFLPDGSSVAFYDQNELSKLERTDADNKKTQTFTDKAGRTILTRVQLDETVGGTLVPWLETYYIYNESGKVRYLISPKGVAALKASGWLLTQAIKDQYVHTFVYDDLGRLVEKKVPGQASIYFCYDRLDRLVLLQDGNLRGLNKWMFTKYDRKGRPVMQGLYINNTHTTRTAVQQNVVDGLYAIQTDKYYEERGATLHGYTNQNFPVSGIEVLAVQYYDTYDFNVVGTSDFSYTPQGLSNEGQPGNAFGLPTGTKKLVFGSTSWLYNYIFYDADGQPIQVRSNNHLSSALDNLITIVYDFEGKTKIKKIYHNAGSGRITTVINKFDYDHMGRVLRIYQNNNASPSDQLVVQYEYNELGQVVDKKLHNTSGASFLQSIDYRYNIQGQLKSINNAQLASDAISNSNDDTNDYFGMEFLYNNTESGLTASTDVYYNGNISAVKWKGVGAGAGATDQQSYKFTYDKADRLKTSTSQKYTGAAWTKEAGAMNENMTYDLNGNILTLKRNQRKHQLSGTIASYTTESIDDLTYLYNTSLGDQLQKVTDAATNAAAGFNNGTSGTANDYTYNSHGSLLSDQNKGISSIVNNILGKPTQINFSDTRKIEYTYDAAGSKLTMKVFAAGSSTPLTTTDYVDGFVYEKGVLSFFGSPEGRVVRTTSGALEYQYSIADHQGNTRVVFSSVNPTTIPIATFEDAVADAQVFKNVSTNTMYWVTKAAANNTTSGQKVMRMNNSYNPTGNAAGIGPAKSFNVFPGDVVDIEVWAYYEGSTGFGGSSQPLTTLMASVASALTTGLPTAEASSITTGVNSAYSAFGAPGNQSDSKPSAFLNYILLDKNYKLLDMGWQPVPSTANMVKQKVSFTPRNVKEAGYMYVYLSYEGQGTNWVYFDDLKVTHTKSNVIQYSEYYPFGLQASTSWTRDQTTGNNFLYNAANELNTTTGWYEMFYRNYDPAIARFMQIDPLATKYGSLSGYHYAFNNPIMFSDPSGAEGILPGPSWEIEETKMDAWYRGVMDRQRAQEAARRGDMDAVRDYARRNGDLQSVQGYYWSAIQDASGNYRNFEITGFEYGAQQGGPSDPPGWGATQAALGASVILLADDVTGVGVVDDIVIPFVICGAIAYDMVQQSKDFKYVTYTKINSATGLVYVGRTSGYGSVDDIVKARDSGHHMNSLGYGTAQPSTWAPASIPGGYSTRALDPAYWSIRGSEQLQIEAYRSQGISGNGMNGISPTNPNLGTYIEAAKNLFGF
jgi:RHS repeat-associated protein